MAGLSAQALTSLGAARAYVLRKETDGSQDTLLTKLINGETRTIIRYLARQLFAEDAATRSFTYSGSGYVSFEPYELRSVDEMILTPNVNGATPLTLDPATADYALEPAEKTPENTYLWMHVPETDNPGAWPPRMGVGLRSRITITGDWGMTEIPEDVEEACLISVYWRYKNPGGAQNAQFGEVNMNAYTSSSRGGYVPPLPEEAIAKLEQIRRPDIGV